MKISQRSAIPKMTIVNSRICTFYERRFHAEWSLHTLTTQRHICSQNTCTKEQDKL